MTKINQEEYEMLKGLDDKWKWIARDEDRGLYVFTKKPVRKDGYSSYWRVAELEDPYTALGLFDEIHLFQFIQWENNEPYNIVELIEDYESEETEVKNIEWMKEKVQKRIDKLPRTYSGLYIDGSRDAYHLALKDIDQLDEPEVLSQEWIDEHEEMVVLMNKGRDDFGNVYSAGTMVKGVPSKKLQNLLVPKQELPVIPRFVAEWFERNRESNTLYAMLKAFNNIVHGNGSQEIKDWVNTLEEPDNNELSNAQRVIARMYLDGYTVEEKKYYVIPPHKDSEGYKMYLTTTDDGELDEEDIWFNTEVEKEHYSDKLFKYKFTKEEVKKIEKGAYWAFAVPVEELEE